VRFQLTARTGHPDFLDLPWDTPLAAWDHDRLVEVPRGLHRHVVRFVQYGAAEDPEGEARLYVLKELPRRYAEREYQFLRHLADEGVPVVTVVGVVSHRVDADGEPLSAVLITEHLRWSLPYRLLFLRRSARELREPMLDALVDLLVRIHLVGFLWGDCSLSNTLFRRDAGRLAAYVVDTETGELHDELTVGQREHDVETAIERCAGELFDLQAAGLLTPEADPAELGDELRTRYARLWDELTREERFSSEERYRIHDRLRRINELGYDVGELELTGEHGDAGVRMRLHVVEPNRHRRLLRERAGIDAQDQQARDLLNDITNFGAWLASDWGRPVSDAEIVRHWFDRSYLGSLANIPDEYRNRREDPELFLEVLDHWHWLSECEGHDVDLYEAARDYAESVLRFQPAEEVVADVEPDDLEDLDPAG
jgi:hypothetical protein